MTSSSSLLKGKTALITGSNRGIGKAITETFAENGADIIACARKESDEFKSFASDLEKRYDIKIRCLYFDLSDEAMVKETLHSLISEKCRIDILVNNAGIAHGGFLHMTPLRKIREVFEVNFFSQMLIIQQISRLMMRRKTGNIINISSVTGLDSYPGYSAYGTSKAALIHAVKVLSREFAPYHIRINAIAAGLTDTDMASQMESKAKEEMIQNSAMSRMAFPQEIAQTALFLASDLSSFITGQIVRVDGGM